MIGAPVQHTCVNAGSRSAREPLEEVVDEFCLQVTHESHSNFGVNGHRCPATEIDGRHAQGFIHGHEKVPSSQDSAFAAQRFVECLSKDDPDIFHGVVLVYLKISESFEVQVEASVMREEFEHVIKEMDTS